MASVEYYFQTKNPEALKRYLSESFGYELKLHPADFATQTDKPDVSDLSNWYRADSYEEWTSNGHAIEVTKIRELSSHYDDVVESHDTILDAFWTLGQGMDVGSNEESVEE